MLNEKEEFRAYTTFPDYAAENKYDSTYLGRFTFAMLTEFTGLTRVLTILARGYMWKDTETPNIDRAYDALCAWCSIPDNKKARPKKDGQDDTDFRRLHKAFPELVDIDGKGWFYRHVQNIIRFSKEHPDKLSKKSLDSCTALEKGFEAAWRNKVLQYQIPLFTGTTKGAWILRFEDIIADALETGPLRDSDIVLSAELTEKLKNATPKAVPENLLPMLVKYYIVNKEADSDWVILPTVNFDAWFGTTAFARKWLPAIPNEVLERSVSSYGVCRYRIRPEYLE